MRKITAIGVALVAGLVALRLLGRRPQPTMTTPSALRSIEKASQLGVGDIVHVETPYASFQGEIASIEDGWVQVTAGYGYSMHFIDDMLSSGRASITILLPAGTRGLGPLARGLAQSARGEVVDLGDFSEYAADDPS